MVAVAGEGTRIPCRSSRSRVSGERCPFDHPWMARPEPSARAWATRAPYLSFLKQPRKHESTKCQKCWILLRVFVFSWPMISALQTDGTGQQ